MVGLAARSPYAFLVRAGVIVGLGIGQAHAIDAPAAVPVPTRAEQVLPHERTIALKHHWTREEVKRVYRIGDVYQPEAMAAINRLLRDWRCDKTAAMDPKLIDLLYELHQELGGHGSIRVVSAFRSEGYNASLLRAGRSVDPDSQHTLGKAVDVIFPGVKADRVRAAAELMGLGGVGYYPFSGPVFVHVDTGPVRQWKETDPKHSRAMALVQKPRGRFVLDCALTTEKLFEDIPAEQAYAALPPGASIKPHPAADLLRASAAAGVPGFKAVSPGGAQSGVTLSSVQEGDGPACAGADPLSRLSLLMGAKPVQPRLKAQARQKGKVKAQVKAAKRSSVKARAALPRKTASGRRLIRKR